MAKRNCVVGNTCYLYAIPAYASNIYSAGNGLAGEITVPPSSLDFWNCTGKSIEVDGKNCLELLSTNKYTFDKKNLLEYMEYVRQEYISNLLHKYETFERGADRWKNVDADGWKDRYSKISKRAFNLEFEAYLKPTRDNVNVTRYYLSSKSEEFLFIIAYCLIPEYTNIRIEKHLNKDGSSLYVFYLEAAGFDNIQDVINEKYAKLEEAYIEQTTSELYQKAKTQSERTSAPSKIATTRVYERDPQVSAYVKKRAEGKCDLCGEGAPFADKKGSPYLEEHHVVRLADGGSDSIDNAVALCPNCHRMIHVLGTKRMKQSLIRRLSAYAELEKQYVENK